jgi:hypothetical protein
VLGLVAALSMTRAAGAADALTVDLDQAQISRVPDRTATVVVGNPAIADISLQPGGIMVVTGKSYGTTNIVTLDRSGSVLTERSVLVRGSRDDVLVVYRGVERETYSCTPRCEPRLTPGDSANSFDPALKQIKAHNDLARELSAPPAPMGEDGRAGIPPVSSPARVSSN